MHITIIEKNSSIPALHYGGTERVIWGLGFALCELGHQVTFIVKKGSYCSFAEVIHYDETKTYQEQIPPNTDFVHFNSIPKEKILYPHLMTMHGNPTADDDLNNPVVYISKNHALRHGSSVFVYNGLLWENYPNVDLHKKRTYLHFLAKASWKVKNLAGAAEIAVKSKNELRVMGGDKWTLYNLKRNPFYTLHPKVSYIGSVNDIQKMNVLSASKGHLFPVTWDEPFGLAIIESMYAGCPVFGTKRGSLPELITENVGFTSDDTNDIIEAVKHQRFDPEVCHEYAKSQFNARVMAENYLKLYHIISKTGKLTLQ